jgi:hypothetical protein
MKTKIVIYDNTGEKTNIKKLKDQEYKEVEKHCLEKKEVIKRGILTKRELAKALKENKLKEVPIIKRIYIDREELANYIKNKDK